MIACSIEKDLGFVFQAAKGPGMNDAIAITLKVRPPLGRLFAVFAATRVAAQLSVRGKALALKLFQLFSRARHGQVNAEGRKPKAERRPKSKIRTRELPQRNTKSAKI